MAELAKLHDRLSKIVSDAETVTRYGRVLEIGSGQAGLDVFAQDIEETRFERHLLFRNERHEELGLHVLAGRILRLTTCDLRDKIPEQLDLIGQDISASDPAALSQLADACRALCNDIHILYVKAEPPRESLKHCSIGVSLETVLEAASPTPSPDHLDPSPDLGPALGVDLGPVRLTEFVDRVSPTAEALLHIVAQDVAKGVGDEDALEMLLDIAESELQFRASEAEEGRVPDADEHCIILGSGPTDSGSAMLCATHGNDLVFVKFPVRDLGLFFATWRDCKLPPDTSTGDTAA